MASGFQVSTETTQCMLIYHPYPCSGAYARAAVFRNAAGGPLAIAEWASGNASDVQRTMLQVLCCRCKKGVCCCAFSAAFLEGHCIATVCQAHAAF